MKEVKLPEGWEWKRLGDCCNSIRYGTSTPPPYSDFGIPFIRATNIKNGTILKNDLKFISKEDSKTLGKCVLREGNLIIVRSGVNTGDCSYISRQYNGALAAYDLIIELGQTYDGKYFNFLINSKIGRYQIDKLKRRAAQEHLNSKQVSSLEFPLPPLPTQRKIVAILEQAETTKRFRAESDELTQRLLQSVFLEMFGDPVKNEKGWEIKKFGEVSNINMGQSPPGESYNKEGLGIALLNGPEEFGRMYPIPKQYTSKPAKCCNIGDILFCVRGATAGRMNWADKKYCIGRGLASIKNLSDQSDIKYLYQILLMNYEKFQKTGRGSTFINIAKSDLAELIVPFPPLPLQQEFSRIVEQVETIRETQRQSAGEINLLFEGLMQKAFTGELLA